MYKSRAALALTFLLPISGCGPELLGGAQGEVRTVATSEEGASSQHKAPDRLTASRSSAPANSSDVARAIEGEMLADAAVWLITDEGDEVALTDGQVPGTFRIEGSGEALLGRADVGARTYTAVRMVFTRVTAIVEGGLVIDGVPVVGPVHVDLGATGSVVVERPIDAVIERRTTQTLVIDLDAHEWLPEATFPGPLVPKHLFSAAVDVRFR